MSWEDDQGGKTHAVDPCEGGERQRGKKSCNWNAFTAALTLPIVGLNKVGGRHKGKHWRGRGGESIWIFRHPACRDLHAYSRSSSSKNKSRQRKNRQSSFRTKREPPSQKRKGLASITPRRGVRRQYGYGGKKVNGGMRRRSVTSSELNCFRKMAQKFHRKKSREEGA